MLNEMKRIAWQCNVADVMDSFAATAQRRAMAEMLRTGMFRNAFGDQKESRALGFVPALNGARR